MSLISADSTREFLTLGSHVFSWGLSQAASGYIYDSPSSQTTPPPPRPTSLQSYWQLGFEHMLLLQLFRKRCLWWQQFFKEASVGESHHQDTSWKGLILERWSPGWLNGCWGAQERSVTFLGWNVRKIIGEKKEKKIDVTFLSQV